jgi:hypothetical protein
MLNCFCPRPERGSHKLAQGSALGFRGNALGDDADRARIARSISLPLCINMRRFCQFGNNHRQKKCNHSIDTFAMSGDTNLRDFFVNYEHGQKKSANRDD